MFRSRRIVQLEDLEVQVDMEGLEEARESTDLPISESSPLTDRKALFRWFIRIEFLHEINSGGIILNVR